MAFRVWKGVDSVLAMPMATVKPLEPGRLTLRRACDGDEEARAEVALACRRAAYLLALQLTRDPEEARDVAQEATLRALRALGRFDPERPLRPWLLRIARNLVHDRWRRRRAHGEVEPAVELLAEPGGEADPERRLELAERQRLVWRALAALPAEAREVIVLRDYRDLAYAEIAEVLGVPIGTVMSRLHRARARLAERVRAELPHDGGRT